VVQVLLGAIVALCPTDGWIRYFVCSRCGANTPYKESFGGNVVCGCGAYNVVIDWSTIGQYANRALECPTCHSIGTVIRIPTSAKVFSIAGVGLASNWRGKTFKCMACQFLW
jgi:hypothetical protein